jgi:hypothetical protein
LVQDLAVLTRTAPLAAGLPSVFRYAAFETRLVVRAFERTVAPVVARTIRDAERGEEVARALLGTSMKVALAMSGYAAMAAVAFDADLAVLGSSFTRVYDDLFDNFADNRIDERIAELFCGRSFVPVTDVEVLLLALYRLIESGIRRGRDDPFYGIITRLHGYQIQSRRQLYPQISAVDVRCITRGKGGLGVTALFALLRPGMSQAEQDVLIELGDVLQLLDDYHDAAMDRAAGVVTDVTLGTCSIPELGRRILDVCRRFRTYYPRSGRRLAGMLYLMLLGGVIRRWSDVRNAGRPPKPLRTGRPLTLLFTRAGNLRPPQPRP